MPKTNPLDTAAIERADHFEASVFLGTGRYCTEPFATLKLARQGGDRIASEVNNGRRAMIYAVSAGRSTFVPNDYQPTETKEPTMQTQLSNTHIGQLTAIITGGGYKRANSKEAYLKRFSSALTEKAGDKVSAAALKGILGASDFDTAKANLEAALRTGKPAEAKPAPKEAAGKGRKAALAIAASTAPAEAPKAAKAPKAAADKGDARKPAGKRAAILEAAQRGELPQAPDFSANTHKPHRGKLATVVAMVEAGDIEGLKAFPINPISSSPKAIDRYRNLAVIALEARR
jgi:hypothetical protein